MSTDSNQPRPSKGRRAILLFNRRSGSLLRGDADRLEACFRDEANRRGLFLDVRYLGESGEFEEMIGAALSVEPDLIVTAGGDGTVKSVASGILDRASSSALGIIPLGTLNMVARDLGLPLEPEAAFRSVLDSQTMRMDAGYVNGLLFLVTAHLGLYPKLARIREHYRGRSLPVRLSGILWHALSLFFRYPPLMVRVEAGQDGNGELFRTWSAVVSNNPLNDQEAPIPVKETLDRGRLVLYISRDRSVWSVIPFTVRILLGGWKQKHSLYWIEARHFSIRLLKRKKATVMIDGELVRLRLPLEFRIAPKVLKVVTPVAGELLQDASRT